MPRHMKLSTLASSGNAWSYIYGTGSIPVRPQSAIDDATFKQVEGAILEDRRVT